MHSKAKKILSIIITIIVIAGWFISIKGLGPINNIKDTLKYGLDINGGVYVVLEADTDGYSSSEVETMMEQTKEVLNNRVNSMGISEASVSIEGENRFRVEMPGVDNADEAIEKIGQTAQLRFTLADGREFLSGSDVKDASADTDSSNGGYKIVLEFTSDGQEKFTEATSLAASGNVTASVKDSDGNLVSSNAVVIWLDDEVLTAPTVSSTISSQSCEITRSGGFSSDEATNTAALIKGGALPLSLHEVSSSVQTASIGEGALNKSIIAGLIGIVIVFILMIVVFKKLGLFADIALALYVLLVLWAMAGMGAVLTLPGIAGIVLGIGMAVDANVIIFSRIREEINAGKSPRVATSEGFKHGLVTVLDSQITTLIATVILYELGSTSVKGFALTLMISIVISIFTAVVITQIFVGALANSRNVKKSDFGCKEDGTASFEFRKDVNILGKRKIFFVISAIVIICGIAFAGIKGFNYGIDFTGGTMIQMEMNEEVDVSEVSEAIPSFDLNETIVHAGDGNTQIIIKTKEALDKDARVEVQNAIEKHFGLDDTSVISSEEFGPTIGTELRNNAIKSILIAAIGMLIYIMLRFKSWKYGVAAVAGLAHDVLVLVGIYAIFGISLNNPFIAAILTIVGYSINDTIVIFDRIRENTKLMKNAPIEEVINKSIKQTLSRTLMTSLTTVAAIIPLLVMVSSQLMSFVLPLMIGVIVGTYSSIFICSPIYYLFNKNKGKSKYVLDAEKKEKAKKRIEAKKEKANK